MQGRAEVAVVGAGIVGLAAADALARAGVDALCFEAAEPGRGQSAGYTRVFRHAHDRADLVELVSCARRGWDEWSELAGESLVGDEGESSRASLSSGTKASSSPRRRPRTSPPCWRRRGSSTGSSTRRSSGGFFLC